MSNGKDRIASAAKALPIIQTLDENIRARTARASPHWLG
jgi:hypothetical protein